MSLLGGTPIGHYRDSFHGSTSDSHATARAFVGCALQFLIEEYLPKIERCLAELSNEQIWWRPNSESNSIGNLVLHVCGNARQWIVAGVGKTADNRTRAAEFTRTEPIDRSELLELLRSTLSEVERVLTRLILKVFLSSENPVSDVHVF